jgi:phosphoglycolate phosphatase-like HAD superfamily hydrolase
MDALRGVFFDMDGTLADTFPELLRQFNAVLAGCDHPPIDRERFISLLGPTEAGMLRTLLPGRSAEELTVLIEQATAAGEPISLFPDIEQVLRACVTSELKTGVFTGAGGVTGRSRLKRMGVAEMIHAFVGGDEVPASKPAPDGLLRLCGLLGLEPAQAVFVGDSPLDIRSANAAGMEGVAVTWGVGARGALLRESPAAVVDSPAELLSFLQGRGVTLKS